jgi:vacuolar-type H+-ATPase subunit H
MTEDSEIADATEIAEERGAERLRARLREMLEERRRVVRVGEQQIEVVEVTAVEDVLGPDIDEARDQPGG